MIWVILLGICVLCVVGLALLGWKIQLKERDMMDELARRKEAYRTNKQKRDEFLKKRGYGGRS